MLGPALNAKLGSMLCKKIVYNIKLKIRTLTLNMHQNGPFFKWTCANPQENKVAMHRIFFSLVLLCPVVKLAGFVE